MEYCRVNKWFVHCMEKLMWYSVLISVFVCLHYGIIEMNAFPNVMVCLRRVLSSQTFHTVIVTDELRPKFDFNRQPFQEFMEKIPTTWIVCAYLIQRSMVPMHIISWAPYKPHPRTHWTNQTHRIDANCAVLDVSLNVTLQVTVLSLCWTNGTASSYMIKLVNLLSVVEISTIDNSNCIGPFPWVFSLSLHSQYHFVIERFALKSIFMLIVPYAHIFAHTSSDLPNTDFGRWFITVSEEYGVRALAFQIVTSNDTFYVAAHRLPLFLPRMRRMRKKEVQVRNREIVTMNWNRKAKKENLWDAVQCDAVVSIL